MVHGAAHDDRPWPSRSGASDRDVGQVLVGQRLPAPAVAGQPVDGQDLRRCPAGRSGARAGVGHGVDAARPPALSGRLVGPPWCHADMSAPHIADPTRAPRWTVRARLRGVVRVLGGAGHRQDQPARRHRGRAHRGRRRPGIGAAADGFGPARRAGPRRDHGGTAVARRRRAGRCASRWCARCTPTRSRCCGWPRSATGIRRRG